MTNKTLKKQIAEILVKYGMPTRQQAINEIMALISFRNLGSFGGNKSWKIHKATKTPEEISEMMRARAIKGWKNRRK